MGLKRDDDLIVHVVARDADDLYRIAGQILDIDGVERTRTSLVMRELVERRVAQLLLRSSEWGRRRVAGSAVWHGEASRLCMCHALAV